MSFHTVSVNTGPTWVIFGLFALSTLLRPSSAWSQLVPGSMDVHWNEGASDCARNPQPPLQLHRYNARTFVVRENLCATFEAPFIYLLVGSTKALLIDTGAVADPIRIPLAKTLLSLLPGEDSTKRPLLVVHTHRHLDHRAGDGQFVHLPHVQVVGFDVDSVRHYYNFSDWPNGVAEIDLGNRTVDVIPTPGHNETEISFYDRNTGLFLSGDFLLPGRLLIDDSNADLASALRAVAFVKDRPVSFVLGAHIEMDTHGNLFPWGSQYHPHEHVLQLTRDDLLALPAALRAFNGFYTVTGRFIMSSPTHSIIALGILAAGVLIALGRLLSRYIRRRSRAREQKNSFAG